MSETTPNPLDNLHIASPCHASWDAMTGDDQARFCKSCNKNVFNLTMMTRAEAEKLIRVKEGNLCVRYSQREDGTILTQDCPVGLERAKQSALRPWRAFAAGIAAVLAALTSLLGIAPRAVAQPPIDTHSRVVKGEAAPSVTMMGGPQVPSPAVREIQGDVAMPRPAKMGEPTVCAKPTQGQPMARMGKVDVATLQGGLQAPVQQATPKAVATPAPLMGMPVPTRRIMGKIAMHVVKPAAKIKKNTPKTHRPSR